MNKTVTSSQAQYKAFAFLSMLYIPVILSSNVLLYKIATIGPFTLTVGSFVTPFWFIITDVIAEVYGYKLARKLIWSGITCEFIFTFICVPLIHLPSPAFWHYQPAYDQVLGKLPRIMVGAILAVLVGSFLNTYLITKWKILIQGKYFWLRSMGSSGLGQLIFTGTSITFDLAGTLPYSTIIELIAVSFAIKLIVTPFATIPASIAVYYLKKLENIDIYDYNTDFNPFKLD
jgi:queuosine precursor transporter